MGSPSGYDLAHLPRQTAALAPTLREIAPAAARDADQIAAVLGRHDGVVLLGSGDSLHAALATEPAFTAGAARAHAMTPTEFLHWRASAGTLVVGISASGGNPALAEAVAAARAAGSTVVAITSAAGECALSTAAEQVLRVGTMPEDPAPGILTYQSSLVGLLALARAIAGSQVDLGPAVVEAVEDTLHLSAPGVRDLARRLAAAPVVHVAASGPAGLGTARHLASKLTETATLPAFGIDVEEWWHVHRFAHRRSDPLVVVATPGAGRDAALRLAERAANHRDVFAVVTEDEPEVPHGVTTVVVSGGVPHLERPLVDHVLAGPLAFLVADARGATPFENP